jgi:hypothetical protein
MATGKKPTSASADVRTFADDTAESYSAMMDSVIDGAVHADTLGRLAARIASTEGALVDTSCGSGHAADPDAALNGFLEKHVPRGRGTGIVGSGSPRSSRQLSSVNHSVS